MILVSTEEAAELLRKGALYIDVRTEAEFGEGHVPGALNVPYHIEHSASLIENPEFEEVMCRMFDKSQKLVVGCQAGARSKAAAQRLSGLGFQHVHDMAGGFLGGRDAFGRAIPGWKTEGREIELLISVDQSYSNLRSQSEVSTPFAS